MNVALKTSLAKAKKTLRPRSHARVFPRETYLRLWRGRLRWIRQTRRDRAALARSRSEWDKAYTNLHDPLISVCIATYNRGQLFVERTLPVILGQTYQNIEVVVVGDHAQPDTVEILSGLDDPRVRFYNLPERPPYPINPADFWRIAGCYSANKGNEMAKGMYIARCDDDDVWTPDHLEVLLDYIKAHPETEWVCGQALSQENAEDWRLDAGPDLRHWRLDGNVKTLGVAHSSVMHRTYLRVINYNPASWKWKTTVDRDRWNRMRRAGVRIGVVRKVITHRPLRPGQLVEANQATIAKGEVGDYVVE